MTDTEFPRAMTATEMLWERESVGAIARRQQRLERWERGGTEMFIATTHVERVHDDRSTGSMTIWRVLADGRLFERIPETGDPPPAVVLFDLGELAYETLTPIDVGLYELETKRTRAQVAEAEAERIRREREADDELRQRPKRAVVVRSLLTLSGFLARVEAVHGTLALHENRVLAMLPVGVNEPAIARALDELRPLLVATDCGQRIERCDLEACEEAAEVIGAGGCWLCVEHGR